MLLNIEYNDVDMDLEVCGRVGTKKKQHDVVGRETAVRYLVFRPDKGVMTRYAIHRDDPNMLIFSGV